jgi:integral membrane sensor domain MASE1
VKLERWALVAEVISGIAVVVTLVFLTTETPDRSWIFWISGEWISPY